jgi:hypothetical protein
MTDLAYLINGLIKKLLASLRRCVKLIFNRKEKTMKRGLTTILAFVFAFVMLAGVQAQAADPSTGSGQGKPNILVIMSDDVGITNISAYSRGLVGYA